MIDTIVARIDLLLHRFAGDRDESDYVRARQQMALSQEWYLQDHFLERQLEIIDQKISGLLLHASLMLVVAVSIMARASFVVGLLAAIVACIFALLAATLLRCTRIFGSYDFLAGEPMEPQRILDRMTALISLRKNVYRRALRFATAATLLLVPLIVVALFALLVR